MSNRPTPTSERTLGGVLDGLTWRERDVLHLICRGMSNDEMAGELYLSPNTIKTYVRQLYEKLGARNRTQVVLMAFQAGSVGPGQAGHAASPAEGADGGPP